MFFCVISFDRLGAAPVRAALCDDHLLYMKALGPRLRMHGPFMSEDRSRQIGSMTVLEAQCRSEAEAIVDNDPFVLANLYERSEIHPWHLLKSL